MARRSPDVMHGCCCNFIVPFRPISAFTAFLDGTACFALKQQLGLLSNVWNITQASRDVAKRLQIRNDHDFVVRSEQPSAAFVRFGSADKETSALG